MVKSANLNGKLTQNYSGSELNYWIRSTKWFIAVRVRKNNLVPDEKNNYCV